MTDTKTFIDLAARWEAFYRRTDDAGRPTGDPIPLQASDFAHCDISWVLNESGDKLTVRESAITRDGTQDAYVDLQGVYSAVHQRVKDAIVGKLELVADDA